MASYNELNALIDAYINRNGVQAITGQILNGVLKAMVEQLGRGYTIMGAATPTTDPGTPDGPECYFASATGTYTDFDGLQVVPGELALLCYTPSDGWTKATIYEGFQEVGATIDGNVGTPSVGVSYANGVLSFDFHNMKGTQGVPGPTGPAAGFGTPTATVDGNVGTPGVSVSASGPDTAKVFSFAFTNLKGDQGDQGIQGPEGPEGPTGPAGVTSVVATVDNTTGNPTCTVSLNAGVLTLAFTGLKGAQGDTGSSVAYPFTIVNNLTTDDATQALSAAQGVVLQGEITQLELKVDDLNYSVFGEKQTIPTTGETYGISTAGEIGTLNTYSHSSPVFCKKGSTVYATARIDSAAYSAIAKTNANETFYENLLTADQIGTLAERSVLVTEDCYITCTYRTDKGLVLKIALPTMDAQFQEIATLINTNTQNLQGQISSIYDSLRKNMVDKNNTYLIITTRGSLTLNIGNMYDVDVTQVVNWGDGSEVTVGSSADLKHTYTTSGTYLIMIKGMVKIPASGLYDQDKLDAVFIGATITQIGNLGIYLNKYLKELHFLGTTIPTFGTNAILISGAYRIRFIVVPDEVVGKWAIAGIYELSANNSYLTNASRTIIYNPGAVFTVGAGGDFSGIKDAIMCLSALSAVYEKSHLWFKTNIELRILSGTVINEQILLNGIDLSYITITYEDYTPPTFTDEIQEDIASGAIVFDSTEGYNSVSVDASSFGDSSHDTRGDVCLFHAEEGARLPTIGCVFKLVTGNPSGVAGIVCNRGSECVVKTLCGFIGFKDGVISNNESSVTIREGITLNCSRWGVHARHNGEVSARSLIATGCGTLQTTECGAAVADRVANMDVREAQLGNSYIAIRASNASLICARAAHIVGGGVSGVYLVQADHSGIINATEIEFSGVSGDGLSVEYGGQMDAFSVAGSPTFNTTKNEVSINGIIYG